MLVPPLPPPSTQDCLQFNFPIKVGNTHDDTIIGPLSPMNVMKLIVFYSQHIFKYVKCNTDY